jgi:hypothetical protein
MTPGFGVATRGMKRRRRISSPPSSRAALRTAGERRKLRAAAALSSCTQLTRGRRRSTYSSSASVGALPPRKHSASTHASSMAMQPPCPVIGELACAASPMSTTRPRCHVSRESHSTGAQWICSSQVTRPLLQANSDAARRAFLPLWAGQAAPLVRDLPAATFIETLVAESWARLPRSS